jgi:Domain of unknown function (DUF222)
MREEIAALGERIAEQAVHLEAAMHRLLADLQAFDAAGGWATQGFQSCAHWLSWRVGWDLRTARDRVRVANKLPGLPKVAAKLEAGELSYSKARAIVRVATSATEDALLVYAANLPAAQLEKVCSKLRVVVDNEQLEAARREGVPPPPVAARMVQARSMDDGMVRVSAVLRPDEAALLMQVIQQAACADAGLDGERGKAPNEMPVRRVNRADGLMTVVQAYARGERPERTPIALLVTVPAAVLGNRESESYAESDAESESETETEADPLRDLPVAELPSGEAVSAECARRLACDAGLV